MLGTGRIALLSVSKTFNPKLIGQRGFQSAYSLDKIYPSTSKKKSIPKPDPEKFTGYIPLSGLEITYGRSTGPGGQHVNTTNSRSEVRFNLQSAEWIPGNIRKELGERLGHKLNKKGELVVRSERTRVQALNLADCLDKIRYTIKECSDAMEQESREPSKETQEKWIALSEAAAQRRLREKRNKSTNRRFKSDMDF